MTNRNFMDSLNNKQFAEFLERILCSGECGCCPMAAYNSKNGCVEQFLNEEMNWNSKIFFTGTNSVKIDGLYEF